MIHFTKGECSCRFGNNFLIIAGKLPVIEAFAAAIEISDNINSPKLFSLPSSKKFIYYNFIYHDTKGI